MKNMDFPTSLNNAVQGFIHVVKSQRNMRIHVLASVLVLVSGVYLDLSRIDFLLVCAAICFVLICEMFNTAIEFTVDLITDEFHPLARIIKDVSAGAVFISAVNAIIIGYIVFSRKLSFKFENGFELVYQSPWHITFISLTAVICLVVLGKAILKRGTPLKGGMPSGHTAVAFAIWVAVSLITQNGLVSLLVFFMAIVIARHRVVSNIHSALETFAGALLGALTTLLLFQLLK